MLPPAATPIFFSRSRLADCVATRRCGVTLTLKIVRGASASEVKSGLGFTPNAAFAVPARPCTRLGNSFAWLEIAALSIAKAPKRPSYLVERAFCGRSAAQTGGVALSPGSLEKFSSPTPDTPSASEWCSFAYSAKRPPCRPSIRWISQSGRSKSIGLECRREISTPSSRSPPGYGSAECRRW